MSTWNLLEKVHFVGAWGCSERGTWGVQKDFHIITRVETHNWFNKLTNYELIFSLLSCKCIFIIIWKTTFKLGFLRLLEFPLLEKRRREDNRPLSPGLVHPLVCPLLKGAPGCGCGHLSLQTVCHPSWQAAIHCLPLPLRAHSPAIWSCSEGQTQGSPGNGLRSLWVGNLEPWVFREWSAGIEKGGGPRFSAGMSSWSGMPHSGHGEWLDWGGGLHSAVILWNGGSHSGITHGSGGFQREA